MTDTTPRTAPATQNTRTAPAAPADGAGRRARCPLRARLRGLPSWALLTAAVLAGGLLGGGYGLLTPPAYTATAYVVATPAGRSDPPTALGYAQAYGRVATQLAVLGDAQVWAGVPVRTLRDGVRASTSPDAPMVALTATSPRPALAADMANAVSRALTRHAAHAAGAKGGAAVTLRQFARATVPGEPSSASAGLTGLVGASAGGLLGALALLARPHRRAAGPGTEHRAAPVPAPASPAAAPAAPASAPSTGAEAPGQS